MSIHDYYRHLELTSDQRHALGRIEAFFSSEMPVFILKGYAGSGKTTLIKGIVEYLASMDMNPVLMAPTGRAAKVISQKTGMPATTIHKAIYSFDKLNELEINDEEGGKSFVYYYKIRNNVDVNNSIFIVDEASMLSDRLSEGEFFRFGSGFLLKDLVAFSRVQETGLKTKILFVGDPAQLPPIGMNISPALDQDYLRQEYNLNSDTSELKEVKRQGRESGILKAAARIRRCLTSGYFNDFDLREIGHDIFNPTYEDFINVYNASTNRKIIITYKNKTALDLNIEIRDNKFGEGMPLQSGDHIIIGHNNYRAGILNGEFGVVLDASPNIISRRISFYTKGGKKAEIELAWRSIELLFPDEGENGKTVKGYILENYLYGDNYLTSEEQQALYVDFKNRNKDLQPHTPEFADAIINDPFFNAIQLKFGYAVTCHKAQGGEWKEAFVFWDRVAKDGFNFLESRHTAAGKTNSDFYRWAYTAITRASQKLNCINPPYFTSFSELVFVPEKVQDAFTELTGETLHTEVIDVDDTLCSDLKACGLNNEPLPIQDHFIELRQKSMEQGIDIIGWLRIGYEIRYSFKREDDQVTYKFWVNGKNEFNKKFEAIPSISNSESLIQELEVLLEQKRGFNINRNLADQKNFQIEFNSEIEETKPFLRILFDRIEEICLDYTISIENLEHYLWMESYSFQRGSERAVMNFHYNEKGFVKKAIPITPKCNSQLLLNDLGQIVSMLKSKSDVIQPG